MPVPSVAIVIPTYNAGSTLKTSIQTLKKSTIKAPVLVADSSSQNQTTVYAEQAGAEVVIIPQANFNHGGTREWARKLKQADIVVFLTQDATPCQTDLIEKLVEPLLQNEAIAVSYGRQIPHDGADIFEAFPRDYNYGTTPQVRGIEDVAEYGVYTFFCSNSFAAYKNAALDSIGGFQVGLTNEDYFAVAKLLQQGYKIAYVPEAVVKHSHRYTLWQEFQRYFDTGYVRAENPIIQQLVGSAEKRGVGMVGALLKKLWQEDPWLIPYAIMQSAVKWVGFRVGFYGKNLPLVLKRQFSQQRYYWK